jgi:hypothetical protein
LVNLTQAAVLAPLVPLADALALSWSRSTTRGNSGAFEYGWVRGVGSAAFRDRRVGRYRRRALRARLQTTGTISCEA